MKPFCFRTCRPLILTGAVLAITACAPSPTAQPNAQYTDDASINASVEAAVISVPGIRAENIKVTTQDAVVTLRGTAENIIAARSAVQAAREVTGVKTVDYDIKVSP